MYRPLHWIQPTGATSVSLSKPDVMWSALNAARVVLQVLSPEETRRGRQEVYLCLNIIITSTFQPLARPPERRRDDAASPSHAWCVQVTWDRLYIQQQEPGLRKRGSRNVDLENVQDDTRLQTDQSERLIDLIKRRSRLAGATQMDDGSLSSCGVTDADVDHRCGTNTNRDQQLPDKPGSQLGAVDQ